MHSVEIYCLGCKKKAQIDTTESQLCHFYYCYKCEKRMKRIGEAPVLPEVAPNTVFTIQVTGNDEWVGFNMQKVITEADKWALESRRLRDKFRENLISVHKFRKRIPSDPDKWELDFWYANND